MNIEIPERESNAEDFCCSTMGEKVTFKCDEHSDPWDCPDYVIVKINKSSYGIPLRDGGSSYTNIDYCPWCGTKLEINTKGGSRYLAI